MRCPINESPTCAVTRDLNNYERSQVAESYTRDLWDDEVSMFFGECEGQSHFLAGNEAKNSLMSLPYENGQEELGRAQARLLMAIMQNKPHQELAEIYRLKMRAAVFNDSDLFEAFKDEYEELTQ